MYDTFLIGKYKQMCVVVEKVTKRVSMFNIFLKKVLIQENSNFSALIT